MYSFSFLEPVDNLLKSGEITLATKVCLVKAMVFLVVMYGCENWTIKKAEHQRIDAFELWCWRRLLRVPWTARRSNQFILKEITPERSLEGLMLKLKLQYFGHLMRRTDLFEKTVMPGKIEGKTRRGQQGWNGWMASLTQWTWVWVNSGSWWWTGRPGVLQSMEPQRVRHDWVTELSWTSFLKYKSPTVPRDTLTLFFIHLPVILLLNYSNMTGELITWNLRNADENGEAQLEPLLNILITICLLFTLTLNGYNLLFPWFKSP